MLEYDCTYTNSAESSISSDVDTNFALMGITTVSDNVVGNSSLNATTSFGCSNKRKSKVTCEMKDSPSKSDNGNILERLRKEQQLNPWLVIGQEWLTILDKRPLCAEDIKVVEGTRIAAYKRCLERYCSSLKEVKLQKECDDYQIQEEVLPCPCVGSPEAPIWLLLKNPGMSDWDWYDFVSIKMGREKIKHELIKDVRTDYGYADEDEALRKRQQLLVRQLVFDFEGGSKFYVFEDVFKTFDGKSKCACGSYEWYKKNLFPAGRFFGCEIGDAKSFASSNLFVLDYHPYHSKSFFEKGMDDIKTPYWDKLVEYGFAREKLMIFWGSKVLEKIRNKYEEEYLDAVKKRHIVVLRGPSASCSVKMADFPVGNNNFVKEHLKRESENDCLF